MVRAVAQHDRQRLGLVRDPHLRAVEVGDVDLRGHVPLGVQRRDREVGELLRGERPRERRQGRGHRGVQVHLARDAHGLGREPDVELPGHLLERLVLQQPGEQQVASLQEFHVVLVLHLAARQQPGGFEIQQGGGDHQELAGLVQGLGRGTLLQRAHVLDELVRDHGEGHLGDVHLVLGDQREQDVEGALEVLQRHGEPAARAAAVRCARSRRGGQLDDVAHAPCRCRGPRVTARRRARSAPARAGGRTPPPGGSWRRRGSARRPRWRPGTSRCA